MKRYTTIKPVMSDILSHIHKLFFEDNKNAFIGDVCVPINLNLLYKNEICMGSRITLVGTI